MEQRYTASIQVGTLRSVAEAEGWHVESNYAYLDFYALAQQTLGVEHANWAEAYELVSEKLYHVSTGDWIYTQRHGDAPAREEYFDLLRAKRIDEATISLIDTLREVADRHVVATTAALLRAAPDVIGFTTTFSQNGPTLAVAERLRTEGFTGTIVLGGSNCEGPMGRALLDNFPAVDAVVDGPGEDAFLALLRQVAAGGPVSSTGRLITRRDTPTQPVTTPSPERLSGGDPARLLHSRRIRLRRRLPGLLRNLSGVGRDPVPARGRRQRAADREMDMPDRRRRQRRARVREALDDCAAHHGAVVRRSPTGDRVASGAGRPGTHGARHSGG